MTLMFYVGLLIIGVFSLIASIKIHSKIAIYIGKKISFIDNEKKNVNNYTV